MFETSGVYIYQDGQKCLYADGKDLAEQECAESLRSQEKQQFKLQTESIKNKLFMSEFKFKYKRYDETVSFLKKTLTLPEKEVLIWEQLNSERQISARHPANK